MEKDNNNLEPFSISITPVKSDSQTLMGIVRGDIREQLQKVILPTDAGAHVLVSVMGQKVFVSCIIESLQGKYRYSEEFTPTSIMELYEMKGTMFEENPSNGAWRSVTFRAGQDGFIVETVWNYDLEVYDKGEKPHLWLEPMNDPDTDERTLLWSQEDYEADAALYPTR